MERFSKFINKSLPIMNILHCNLVEKKTELLCKFQLGPNGGWRGVIDEAGGGIFSHLTARHMRRGSYRSFDS